MSDNDWISLVTGSTRGIGFDTARRLLAAGARVAINGRTPEAVDEAISKLDAPADRVYAAPADISDQGQIERVFAGIEDRWGPVDVLVNNAAWWEIRPTLDITPDIWRRMIDVNLSGLFYCGQRALRRMAAMRRGVIVNVTSIAAKTGGKNPVPHYAASKAGVLALTKVWATEFAPFNIRVNAVSPGIIDTDMAASIVDEFSPMIPLKRAGAAEEVSDAILFLIRQIDGYITGEILDVNGGLLMD